MGTTLTKPVLLDETGQAIVEKLDEIKDAIDSGGSEKYPVLIHITTPPTKTSYIAGEQLNLAGMVVKAVFSNNVEYDVTDQCTFSPANGTVLASGDGSVVVTYIWHPTSTTFTATQNISIKELASIAITTPPTQTNYNSGDALDLSGMVVTATFDDSTTIDATSQCVFNPADGATLTTDDTEILVSLTIGSVTKTTTQAISVVAIYGVEWDGTASSAFTRTDAAANFEDPNPYYSSMDTTPSSPFDNIMPWAGIEKYEDSSAGTLVKIPKFYFKWTLTGASIKLQISDSPQEGFYTSPAHADRGDGNGERDYVYVGAYLSAAEHNLSRTKYKSVAGDWMLQEALSTARTNTHNLGSDIWLMDFSMYWTICMLYLVEYADWDSSRKIGLGGGFTNSGNTDSITYHTGTTATTRENTSNNEIKYRHIEGLWFGAPYWCDGFRMPSGSFNVYCEKNPSRYSNSSYSQYIGLIEAYSDWLSAWKQPSVSGYEFVLLPKSSNATEGYVNDQISLSSSNKPYLGISLGSYSRYHDGLFAWTSLGTSDTAYLRLMKLPNNS